MGTSIELLQKDFLILSVEIDNNVSIELSTGFGGPARTQVSASIPVTIEEFSKIVDEMVKLRDRLLASWKCSDCGEINPVEEMTCCHCDKVREWSTLPRK